MRGKAKELPPRQCYLGITPAYAGKSTRPFSSGHENGDHPRVCGEKQKTPPWGVEKGGSPPRMRGKGVQPRDKRVAVRITPAYAGKRGRTSICLCNIRDHPRVCGEKPGFPWSGLSVGGSPPRMRGKAVQQFPKTVCGRITPAYAGKRLKRSHRIGHFSCILCLFHSVLHRASASGGSRAGPCAPPCLPAQNAVPV